MVDLTFEMAHTGLKDGVPVKAEDVPSLTSIVHCGLGPEASREMVASCIADRPARATAYV